MEQFYRPCFLIVSGEIVFLQFYFNLFFLEFDFFLLFLESLFQSFSLFAIAI